MKRSDKILHWLPKILTTPCFLLTVCLCYITIDSLPKPHDHFYDFAQVIPFVLIIASIIIAWKYETIGGILILVTFLISALIAYFFIILWYLLIVYMSVLLIPAAIILIFRNIKRKKILIIISALGIIVFVFGIYANTKMYNNISHHKQPEIDVNKIKEDMLKELNK